MRAAAFSQRGLAWSERLGVEVERPESVMRWAAEAFGSSDALLFIGAVGIAVRAIAPLLRSKTVDPAVVVMDELGRHVIPILSGHIGGANELALEIARRTGAQPVITTATDINGVPAIDVWAKKHDCAIENPQAIKAVSSAVLSGGQVGVMITERDIKPPFEVTLKLRPRTLVLGAGCRRGTDAAAFERAALDFLDKCGVSLLAVRALATIDIKSDEHAFVTFARKYALEMCTYTAEELAALPGEFAHSDYVFNTVGVGNVSERAAVCAGGARLLRGKTLYAGITLALAGDAAV